MTSCTDCGRTFSTHQGFLAHCRSKEDHHYCEECDRFFVHSNALHQHLQHSPSHRYDRDSDSDSDSDYSDDSDEGSAYCKPCARFFVSKLSLYQHLSASPLHNWCFVCSRDFSTESALNQHTSSRAHRSRNLNCPLCSKLFKTPSAIALHIESGCHNISRHQVTAAVHSLGVIPTISITRRLHNSTGVQAPRAITHYSASERAFNGTAYQCYLCHRTFKTLRSLDTHLASPAHDADEFKCPKCKKKYKLISGLIQHIESEVCGMARFEQVESAANDFTAQFARLLKF